MSIRDLISEGERLNRKIPKHHYKCPFCAKRFRAIPQRTIHSPYPSCPICGVPVSEDHRIRPFDRTRKALKIAAFPIIAPFKLVALVLGLSWAGTKVGARGIGLGAKGIGRGILFILLLPLNIIREYRRKRFADPATLEKYLEEVKDQWQVKEPLEKIREGYKRYIHDGVPQGSGGPQRKVTTYGPEDLEDDKDYGEIEYIGEEDYGIAEQEYGERLREIVEHPAVTVPLGKYERVVLSEEGRLRFKDDLWNPHQSSGVIERVISNEGKREWFIRWSNGNHSGPYLDSDITFLV